jgi:hypothetical protein
MGDSGGAGVNGDAATTRFTIVTSDPRAGVNTQALVQGEVPYSVVDMAGLQGRIPRAAHIQEAAASNRPLHLANTCRHMDRDGNPADKDTARMRRTRSAPARREARR